MGPGVRPFGEWGAEKTWPFRVCAPDGGPPAQCQLLWRAEQGGGPHSSGPRGDFTALAGEGPAGPTAGPRPCVFGKESPKGRKSML